jgi:hypothetical protein
VRRILPTRDFFQFFEVKKMATNFLRTKFRGNCIGKPEISKDIPKTFIATMQKIQEKRNATSNMLPL